MVYGVRHMEREAHRTFRSWLAAELAGQNVPRRELARRLAAQHPKGVTADTIETYRRAVYRYLDPVAPMIPNQQTRAAFADALGVSPDEVPVSDDEDEPDLTAALQAIALGHVELGRQLTRALKVAQAEGASL